MNNVETVRLVVGVVLSLVLPFVAEPLNRLWKLDGPKALAVAGVLAGVVSLIVLYVTGAVTNTQLTTLTTQNFLSLFAAVYGVSQTTFQLIKQTMHWDSPPVVGTPAVG